LNEDRRHITRDGRRLEHNQLSAYSLNGTDRIDKGIEYVQPCSGHAAAGRFGR